MQIKNSFNEIEENKEVFFYKNFCYLINNLDRKNKVFRICQNSFPSCI